jgi:transposase-like protein
MEPRKTAKTYSPEVRARAVRMVTEHQGEHGSQWAAICSIAAKIGCSGETLRGWVRQGERDQGLREGMTSETRERLKALERENRAARARLTRSCARPARILRWRSSTAGPGHDRVHRRSPRRPWGRADLQGAADRPVDVPQPHCPSRRTGRRPGERVVVAVADAAHRGFDGLRGPWRSLEAVELATLDWVDRFNNRRLLEPIGNIPPAEAEARYYAQLEEPALAA